jgi:hypothetical protein
MRVSFAKEPVRYSEERESETFDEEEEEEEEGGEAGLHGGVDGGLTIKPRSIRRTKSWDGSVRGTGSRRVPSNKRGKGESGKEKKEGWLEWFLTATTAGAAVGGPGHMAASMSSSMGIGREEMFGGRGGEGW